MIFIILSNSYANPVDTYSSLVKKGWIKEISFPGLQRVDDVTDDSVSFILPFSRAGNLILIKAKADSTEGNFILDTGCPGLVLNITYFRHYNRTSEPGAENTGINGVSAALEHTVVKNFYWGALTQNNIKADLANLGAIENSKGIKILGLVGMEFFKELRNDHRL
jgi:hypothetical protein